MARQIYTPRNQPGPVREALGESEVFLNFQAQLSRVAQVDRPVLIVGERGTGKELAAHRLHYLSSRWKKFEHLNCATLAPTLIESELFGYEAGAFTGAVRSRAGRFEAAGGGTLFLDEIGSIPLEVQAKILRVVEYGLFERVGGTAPIQVDVRIIGATNADLPALAAEGRFQPDLLDRLSFEVLVLPPLRERRGDILLLANHFAVRMAHELGWSEVPVFSDEAAEALEAHAWPGNVRELKNVVERAVYRSDSTLISDIVFNPFPTLTSAMSGPESKLESDVTPLVETTIDLSQSLPNQVARLEKRLLKEALSQSRYNQKKAAGILGLSYNQFRGLYRKYGGSAVLVPEDR